MIGRRVTVAGLAGIIHCCDPFTRYEAWFIVLDRGCELSVRREDITVIDE